MRALPGQDRSAEAAEAAETAETAAAAGAVAAGQEWRAEPATGGRPYVYLEGRPGAVLEDGISVTNPAAEPLTVRLRATGTAWLAFAEDRVTVPARTRADVPFAVTVPATAPPGDRPAKVVVSAGGHEAAVRVHVRVTGPELGALTVEDLRVEGRSIRYTLVNRGNTVLEPRLAVRADGLTGALLRRPARTLPVELGPGRSLELSEPWPDPPALDSVDITLRVTAPGAVPAEATASARYVPWAAATGTALALGAAAGALALWRGRERGPGRHGRRGGSEPSGGSERSGAPRRPPAQAGDRS